MLPIIRIQAPDERIDGKRVLMPLPALGEQIDVQASDSTVFILKVKDHIYDVESFETVKGKTKQQAVVTLVCTIIKKLPPRR